ncbi:hypothetical protein BH10ACI2_BH10ACI2_17450 [soil metagenome]
MMANWLMAKAHFLMGILHFFAALCKPSQRSFKAASSVGKADLVLVIFLSQ